MQTLRHGAGRWQVAPLNGSGEGENFKAEPFMLAQRNLAVLPPGIREEMQEGEKAAAR